MNNEQPIPALAVVPSYAPFPIVDREPEFPCTLLYYSPFYGWQIGYFVNGGQDYFLWKQAKSLLPWTHWQPSSLPIPPEPGRVLVSQGLTFP